MIDFLQCHNVCHFEKPVGPIANNVESFLADGLGAKQSGDRDVDSVDGERIRECILRSMWNEEMHRDALCLLAQVLAVLSRLSKCQRTDVR